MKKFEYLVMDTALIDAALKRLGAEGWELIISQILTGKVEGLNPMAVTVTKSRLIFKREVRV